MEMLEQYDVNPNECMSLSNAPAYSGSRLGQQKSKFLEPAIVLAVAFIVPLVIVAYYTNFTLQWNPTSTSDTKNSQAGSKPQ
jgi:hypothetical protein